MSTQESIEREIEELRRKLKRAEDDLARAKCKPTLQNQNAKVLPHLSNSEIARFSRQIILPEIGVKGQLKLKNGSALIVGAGGLGCPAAQYLIGAGIGHIGLCDYDAVEINNLHRQLLHGEDTIGLPKVESAKSALLRLNSTANITVHNIQLNSANALEIISKYQVILDASDNVPTRYLLNDACVILGKPLVSGAALKFEGQLTVYNHNMGPCYRCIFPMPPPPKAVTNCGEGGVLGVIPGIIGTIQALETIKILLGETEVLAGKLLLFDGISCSFRTMRLRGKRESCDVCSIHPTITKLVDYEMFCAMRACDKDPNLNLLAHNERISVQKLNEMIHNNERFVLIDVRSPNEFEICRIETSLNVPIKDILDNTSDEALWNRVQCENLQVLFICRRGNDSQIAAKHMQQQLRVSAPQIVDVVGGLHRWAQEIDSSFPVY